MYIEILMLYIALNFIILVINLKVYKKILTLNIIFNLIWTISAIGSMYNSMQMLNPRPLIHIWIIISIIFFNIIFFAFTNIKYLNIKNESNYQINYKSVYLMFILGVILISPQLIKVIDIIATYGINFNIIRKEIYVSLSISNNHILAFLTKNIPTAIFGTITLVSVIDFYQFKSKKLFKLAILSILVVTIVFGGRYSLLNYIIFLIAGGIIYQKYSNYKLKKRYICSAVIILFILTVSRGVENSSIIDMVFRYFSGSLSYLEYILENSSMYGFEEGYMFGYLTFGFIFEPIILVIKFLFNVNIDIPGYYFNVYCQNFVNIGLDKLIMYNNNTSMLYIFLRDFGQWGIIIGASILSFSICKLQKKVYRNGNLIALAILIYMYSVIINSVMMYTLNNISFSLIFICICFSFKKTKNIKLTDESYIKK